MSDTTPVGYDAERAAIGAALQSPGIFGEIESMLDADDFDHPHHGAIWRAMLDLAARGEKADATTLLAAMEDAGTLQRIGGALYLHEIIAAPPTIMNGPHYARIVAQRANRRRVIIALKRSLAEAEQAEPGDVNGVIDRALTRLTDVTGTGGNGGPTVWRDIIGPGLQAIEEKASRSDDQPAGIPTGFVDLDRLLGGLRPGQLITIAGRPGSGKSVLLGDIARTAAVRHKMPAALFSLEMSKIEVFNRMVSALGRVPLHSVNSGDLVDEEWARIMQVCGETEVAPLFVDDTTTMTVADIRAAARQLHRQHGLRVILVDYLQLVSPPKGSDNRQQAVGAMTRALKLLAGELQVPVIIAAQLNRQSEQRADKRPMLSDLRESGDVENHSDVVILVHRDDYYDKESPRAGEGDFIVAKNRGGPQDTITVASQLHLARFADLAVVGP